MEVLRIIYLVVKLCTATEYCEDKVVVSSDEDPALNDLSCKVTQEWIAPWLEKQQQQKYAGWHVAKWGCQAPKSGRPVLESST